MTKKSISFRVHVPLEVIESVLYSAAQGSSYWCASAPGLGYESTVKAIMKGGYFLMEDTEGSDGISPKIFKLTLLKIKKGLTILAKKHFEHLSDIVKEDADQNTADALIQCALFGEIIYG